MRRLERFKPAAGFDYEKERQRAIRVRVLESISSERWEEAGEVVGGLVSLRQRRPPDTEMADFGEEVVLVYELLDRFEDLGQSVERTAVDLLCEDLSATPFSNEDIRQRVKSLARDASRGGWDPHREALSRRETGERRRAVEEAENLNERLRKLLGG